MNKEVKELIQPYNPNIKNGVWYVTSGTRDVKKPYLLARLEELEAENKLLKEKVNQLETNIEEALKTTKELYEEGVEWHWDNGSLEMYVLDLLSILKRGKE